MDQLRSEISNSLKTELEPFLKSINQPKEPADYLTRKQAAALLRISLPTLNEWTKTGTLKGYRIGSRIRYKRGEVESSMLIIKTRKSF